MPSEGRDASAKFMWEDCISSGTVGPMDSSDAVLLDRLVKKARETDGFDPDVKKAFESAAARGAAFRTLDDNAMREILCTTLTVMEGEAIARHEPLIT